MWSPRRSEPIQFVTDHFANCHETVQVRRYEREPPCPPPSPGSFQNVFDDSLFSLLCVFIVDLFVIWLLFVPGSLQHVSACASPPSARAPRGRRRPHMIQQYGIIIYKYNYVMHYNTTWYNISNVNICVYIYREREIDRCVYIYIYIYRERERYIYIYIYITLKWHISIYIYIYVYIYIYIYICICICICTYCYPRARAPRGRPRPRAAARAGRPPSRAARRAAEAE